MFKKIKTILFTFYFITIATNLFSQAMPTVSKGSIVRIDHLPSKYVDKRIVDVWLPEGYNKNKKYAVLYMQDGQMLYDSTITWNKKSWNINYTISKLINENKIKEVIVVGIWNGDKKRHAEYFPQKPFENLSTAQKNKIFDAVRSNNASVFNNNAIYSDNYLKYIVQELKPYIDQQFSTYTNAKNTFIGGSSMGGLISMYAICEYPTIFGGAICMSTHWPGIFEMESNPIPAAFLNYLSTNLPSPKNHKLYFDCGDQTLDALYPPLQNKVDSVMRIKGFSEKNWMTKYFINQDHSEPSWSSRMDIPLAFLLHQ
jgi:hypothetical protein